jgi:hypothetical protein
MPAPLAVSNSERNDMKDYDEEFRKAFRSLKKPLNRNILIAIVLLAIILFFITSIAERKWYHSYESLQPKDTLNNILARRMNNHGAVHLVFKNGRKYKLMDTKNENYSPVYLGNFIKYGDKIFKNSNSDTIYVKRNGEEFFFILQRYIND